MGRWRKVWRRAWGVLTSLTLCSCLAVVSVIEAEGPTADGGDVSHELSAVTTKAQCQYKPPDTAGKTLLFVSTLDGTVSALDIHNNGENLWSVKTQSLFSSNLNLVQMTREGRSVRLAPSLDGGIYQLDGTSVEPLPFTADSLLSSSYRLADDTIIVGGKEMKTYGINVNTGELQYICSMSGCESFKPPQHNKTSAEVFEGTGGSNDADVHDVDDGHGVHDDGDGVHDDGDGVHDDGDGVHDDVRDDGNVLVVKLHSKTVRTVDIKSGQERWNFSVGEQDFFYVGSRPDGYHGDGSDNDGYHGDGGDDDGVHVETCGTDIALDDVKLQFGVMGGEVTAVSNTEHKTILWQKKLDVPLSSVWALHDGRLYRYDLFNGENIPALASLGTGGGGGKPALDGNKQPMLLLGSYQKQMYIMPSPVLSEATNRVIDERLRGAASGAAGTVPEITWKPYIASAPSRTPAIVGQITSHGTGSEPSRALITLNDVEYPFDGGLYLLPSKLHVIQPEPATEPVILPPTTAVVTANTIWTYWKEIVIVSIILSIFIHLTCSHYQRSQVVELPVTEVHSPSLPLKPQTTSCHQLIEMVETIDETPPTQLTTLSSQTSQESTTPTKPDFVSRYLNDFTPEECLGSGGFGVVYKAKNNMDDCQYAIKRISLPDKSRAKERVMREVKALAKLDHVGIVRYFQAWFEYPPPGWQPDKYREILCASDNSSLPPTLEITSPEASRAPAALPGHLGNPLRSLWSSLKLPGLTKPVTTPTHDDHTTDSSIIFQPDYAKTSLASKSFEVVFCNDSDEDDEDDGSGDDEERNVVGEEDEDEDKGASPSSSLFKKCVERRGEEGRGSVGGGGAGAKGSKIYLYIQMQLCRKDSLREWLQQQGQGEGQGEGQGQGQGREHGVALAYFHQIVDAVSYVHDKGVIHRDLKPSNIFFSPDGFIKIGDFGLATAISEEQGEVGDSVGLAGTTNSHEHTDKVGTELYMSPEQLSRSAYNHKVDIYSLGLILLELLWPFSTHMERVKCLAEARAWRFPSRFTEKYPKEQELVCELLSEEAEDRPEASDVLAHEILSRVVINRNTSTASLRGQRRQSSRTLSSETE